LVGNAGALVEPGATTTVTVAGDPRLFRHWDEASGGWKPLTSGELPVARGLGDVRASIALH